MANLCRLKGNRSEAEVLLSASADLLQAAAPMHVLPGYQTFNGRLWQVRALLQADCGNLLRSGASGKVAHASRRAAIGCVQEESVIDMQWYQLKWLSFQLPHRYKDFS